MAAEMKINKKASGSRKKGLQHVNFRIVDYMETTESTDIFIFHISVSKTPRNKNLLKYEIISQENMMWNTSISGPTVHLSMQLSARVG